MPKFGFTAMLQPLQRPSEAGNATVTRAWELLDAEEAAARSAWRDSNCSARPQRAACERVKLWSVAVISRGGCDYISERAESRAADACC